MSFKVHRYQVEGIGELFKNSKQKYLWDFSVDGKRHTIILEHSLFTNKRRVIINGYQKYENEDQFNVGGFQYSFKLNENDCNIVQQGVSYELRVNSKVFSHEYNQQKQKDQFKWEDDAEINESDIKEDEGVSDLKKSIKGEKIELHLAFGKGEHKSVSNPGFGTSNKLNSNKNDLNSFDFNNFGNQKSRDINSAKLSSQQNPQQSQQFNFNDFNASSNNNNNNNNNSNPFDANGFDDFANFSGFTSHKPAGNSLKSSKTCDFSFYPLTPPQPEASKNTTGSFLPLGQKKETQKKVDLLDLLDTPTVAEQPQQSTQIINQQQQYQQPSQQQQLYQQQLLQQQQQQQQQFNFGWQQPAQVQQQQQQQQQQLQFQQWDMNPFSQGINNQNNQQNNQLHNQQQLQYQQQVHQQQGNKNQVLMKSQTVGEIDLLDL